MNFPKTMHAMVLAEPGKPLLSMQLPVPVPEPGQVLVKIIACGVCRTDLHVVDGELKQPKLPLVPGHEIIGQVVRTGQGVTLLQAGDIIGIPWLGYTCGNCTYCRRGQENLCSNAGFTGYTINGGYAEYTVADERYCFPVPPQYANAGGTPLLCAGLIGYRSYKIVPPQAGAIGIYGFGAAAHILTQVAVKQGKKIFAFSKPGEVATQQFARRLGASWAGDTLQYPPIKLDAAIVFAPAGELVPLALRHVDKGGTVVCAGIHMSDIPSFPYSWLWEERVIRSVANLTRKDGVEFLQLAPEIPVQTETKLFSLEQANEALDSLRNGHITGAAVLAINDFT